MMNGLIKEYNLQNYLDVLASNDNNIDVDPEESDNNNDIAENIEEDEKWDEELEELLGGLL